MTVKELPPKVEEWPEEWRSALEGRATFIHKGAGYPMEVARGISEQIQRGRYRVGDQPLGVAITGLPAIWDPEAV